LIFDPRFCAKQAERKVELALLVARPAIDVLDRMLEGTDRADDVGQHRLFAAAMSEIVGERRAQGLAILDQ
jgi:hypothetical protein